MVLVIDENVPDPLASYLHGRGHDVHLVRDELGPGTPDADVVAHALNLYAAVVTWNHRHFNPHAMRALESGRKDVRHWGLWTFHCPEAMALPRARLLIDLIELEYQQARYHHPDCLLLYIEIHERHFLIRR